MKSASHDRPPIGPWLLFVVMWLATGTPQCAEAAARATAGGDWTQAVMLPLIALFSLGAVQSVRTWYRARRTLRVEIERARPGLDDVRAIAEANGTDLPLIVILVPAYDESLVIENTVRRLAALDYPQARYAVVVITDAREHGLGREVTTRSIAECLARDPELCADKRFLHVIEVPTDYGGIFGDGGKTGAGSSKGRALNYGLEYVERSRWLSQAHLLGVLDADGRLHRDVLREAAHSRLTEGTQLMQGPVFQISNLRKVGLIGKAAGIELSIYHLSTLAYQLRSRRHSVRFLAGTNYFVDRRLMVRAGGWNPHALVEDAELGLRLFLDHGVRASWLSAFEVEQTPPDRRTYLRQRERWALGHFQLLPMIRTSALPWRERVRLRAKIIWAVAKSATDVGLPVLAWLALALGWAATMPTLLGWWMLGLLIASVFVWDFFGRGLGMLNRYAPEPLAPAELAGVRLCCAALMPWLMVVQAQPRLVALFKHVRGRSNRVWVKTPRTGETVELHAGRQGGEPVLTPAGAPKADGSTARLGRIRVGRPARRQR